MPKDITPQQQVYAALVGKHLRDEAVTMGRGYMRVETMSREEFVKLYPSDPFDPDEAVVIRKCE